MKRRLKKLVIPAIVGLFVFLLFRFIVMLGYVPTESMAPTIAKGSYILASRIFGEFKRGDIILFRRGNDVLVKRIAAVPGDMVCIVYETGAVSINERISLIEPLEVPENCYYVLGDNGEASRDSRHWENPFVKGSDILAVYIE